MTGHQSAAPVGRLVLWRCLFRAGTEVAEVTREPSGSWRAVGDVHLAHEGRPVHVQYQLGWDAGWRTRFLGVVAKERPGEVRVLSLRVGADGRWQRSLETVGDERLVEEYRDAPALAGLVDVDLGCTPLTNTLPIRRLALAVGASAEVTAAWVRFPELTVEPLPQRYTRLGERRYRYESGGGPFRAELAVDDLGLVTRYEGGWERVAVADAAPFSAAIGLP